MKQAIRAFVLLLVAPAVLAQTTVQLQDHSGNPPAPTEGVPFDAAAYYKAKADFARERAQWEELEARRYARYSARLNLGDGGGSMATVIDKAMSGCSSKDSGQGGFWQAIGNRMGRAKECREQQTTARVMMCNLVAVELQNPGVVSVCAKIAENDNQWIGFWTQALKSGVTLAGIHYGAGVLTEIVGLGRFAVDAGAYTAQQALGAEPFVAPTQIVEPTVIETPPPEIIQVNQPIEGGGGG